MTDYFEHFDVPLVTSDLTSGSSSRLNIDFTTGASLNASTLISSNVTALATGLLGYKAEIAKYKYLASGWNLTYPIPEDLTMPFGDFLESKGLDGAAFIAFSYAAGCGNILAQPTLYVMKYLTELQVDAIISSGFLANGLGNNQELYNRALAELGDSAFLSSTVYNVTRDASGVEVHIYTPQGPKRIKARKLLITIPPKLENLTPFLSLDTNERSIFSEFNNTYYWDMMIQNTGFPTNASLNNLDPDNALQIPAMPAVYNIGAVSEIPGTFAAYYGSVTPLTDEQVKAAVTATLARIRAAQGWADPAENLDFVGFNSHAPFVLTVPIESVQAGFYDRLVALQGEKDTWYTGAAWNNQASGEIWDYTEAEVLPGLVRSLGLSGLAPISATSPIGSVNGTGSGLLNNATTVTPVKAYGYGGKKSVASAKYGKKEYRAPTGDSFKQLKKAVENIKGYKGWF